MVVPVSRWERQVVLKQRLLTAALLIPLVIAGIFWTTTTMLAWVLAIIVLQGAWEWTRLMGLVKRWQRGLYLVLIALLLIAASGLQGQMVFLQSLLLVVMLLWCIAIAWIISLNRAGPLPRRNLPLPLTIIMGVWLLIPTWLSLLVLHGSGVAGPVWVLLMMVLIWGADSGAYFSGRRWGRHKLAKQLSPGKTWEGVGGGALLALLLVLPLTLWSIPDQLVNSVSDKGSDQLLLWSAYGLVCLLTIVFSVSGDLLESVAKRRAGVKDSGQLLPGHGGVLDRIDSLTAAAPCFTLGLLWLGMIPGVTL